MTIEEFVAQRLDEDEAIASAADRTRWLPEDKGVTFEYSDIESDYSGRVAADTKANMNHIAGNDPDSVLRDIAGKRKILAECEAMDNRDAWWLSSHTCEIVHALASRWANHPDYQPGWNA